MKSAFIVITYGRKTFLQGTQVFPLNAHLICVFLVKVKSLLSRLRFLERLMQIKISLLKMIKNI